MLQVLQVLSNKPYTKNVDQPELKHLPRHFDLPFITPLIRQCLFPFSAESSPKHMSCTQTQSHLSKGRHFVLPDLIQHCTKDL